MMEIKDPNGEKESLLFDEIGQDILDRKGNRIHIGCDIKEIINEEFWFNEFDNLFSQINEVVELLPFVVQKLLERRKRG